MCFDLFDREICIVLPTKVYRIEISVGSAFQ